MHVKNVPRLRLADLLRRRKTTLLQFLRDSGVQAYGSLVERCNALGVQPPSEEEYVRIVPVPVSSSQQDGVVVVDPLPVVDDLTGRQIDPEAPVFESGVEVIIDEPTSEIVPTDDTQKKRRKKKETTQET